MKRRLKEPFGKAGLTVAILALVLAMVGGAYAAGGLTKPQEKQVKKIAKKEAQKYANSNPGAPGANGTNGSPGAAGKDGTNGANGTNGESVTVTSIPTSSTECSHLGGAKFKNATGEGKACNGQTGFTDTLPSGKTETGTWGTVIGKKVLFGLFGVGQIPVSFTIPLAAALPEANIQINPEGFPTGATTEQEENCPGTAESPQAAQGFLCIYKTTDTTNPTVETINVNTPAGVLVTLTSEEEGRSAFGTWAVTAE